MGPDEKCCVECGTVHQDTPEHFPVFRKSRLMCLACVAKRRKARQAQKNESRARQMAKIESKAVDTLLAASRQGGATIPHSAELLEQLMDYFGGTAGFSSVLLKQYFDAKPGSSARTKMLEMVTRLVTTNAEQGGSKKPLTFWTEEELNAEMEQRLVEAASSIKGVRVIDATVPALEVEHATAAEAPEAE